MKLHDVGEGVAEAEITEWRIQVGDTVTADDVVAEVMSDKATIELYSPVDGTVTWLAGEVGDVVAVGAELMGFQLDGDARTEGDVAPIEAPTIVAPAVPAAVPSLPRRSDSVLAAPAVRQRAMTLGIDLTRITGTGPDGRIVHADIDASLQTRVPTDQADEITTIKVTGLRRNIAKRMQAAKRRIPHFTYVEEIDVTELERLRAQLNGTSGEDRSKLSLLPFLMRAVVLAVHEHPEMNARYDDEADVVEQHRGVHLGIATQTPRGLMVPVLRHAETLDLWACSAEIAKLADAARSGKGTREQLSGSTITITSLGALGGIVSTPVINAPEVAIIGVNKIATRPVYIDGVLVPRQIMNLSSSFDHRIIDGVNAATFVQDIKRLLETPALLWTG
ncbi:MAG: Dihydrolipoamide acyltransferase component of branched-chain alpha-keto acid dehydrogenase complex [Ilumatobacteraceae bacterium]|nr:Dihydrolipoamide acyltransferase component of branched-chain alpha-keto acid dehydrogenase complex [Ilumatobacteraceae bacterium]